MTTTGTQDDAQPPTVERIKVKPKRRRWRRLLVEIALFLAVFLGIQWWQARSVVRGAAPPLEGTGLGGERLSLEALRGRPALVHFWATWCSVCRAEEGTIAGLAREVPMVTVASSSGEADAVRRYLAERKIELPVIVDPEGTIAARFGVRAFPTSIVVDPRGEISASAVGYTTGIGLRARLWMAR